MKEEFYLVTYKDSVGNMSPEGVFTRKSFKEYLKENNKRRKEEGELIEHEDEFKFERIDVYFETKKIFVVQNLPEKDIVGVFNKPISEIKKQLKKEGFNPEAIEDELEFNPYKIE